MEMNTQRRVAGLRDKIPDIQKTLDTVMFLESRKVQQPVVLSTQGEEWNTDWQNQSGLLSRNRVDL